MHVHIPHMDRLLLVYLHLNPTNLIISCGYIMFNFAFLFTPSFLGMQLECKRKVRYIKKGITYNAMEV